MNTGNEIQKAYEAILSNDFEQAIRWFEQAIAIDPGNASYHYRLSITCARSEQLGKAIEHAETACRLEPDQDEYKLHLQLLYARHLLELAQQTVKETPELIGDTVETLKSAIVFDPLLIEAYLLLAAVHAAQFNYTSAIQTLGEVLKLDPQHAVALTMHKEYSALLSDLSSDRHQH